MPKPWHSESLHIQQETEALEDSTKEIWRFEITRTRDDPEWKLTNATKKVPAA